MIVPTVGRVVWFWPGGRRAKENGVQPYAALVAFVHSDRLVNLGYVDANGGHSSATSVTLVQEGDAVPDFGFAEWMPYQVGQAKAQAAAA